MYKGAARTQGAVCDCRRATTTSGSENKAVLFLAAYGKRITEDVILDKAWQMCKSFITQDEYSKITYFFLHTGTLESIRRAEDRCLPEASVRNITHIHNWMSIEGESSSAK